MEEEGVEFDLDGPWQYLKGLSEVEEVFYNVNFIFKEGTTCGSKGFGRVDYSPPHPQPQSFNKLHLICFVCLVLSSRNKEMNQS